MTMPRPLPPPERASFPLHEVADYDMVVNRNAQKFGGQLPPYHATLLHSPPFAAALNALGKVVRTTGEREGTYSHADRELVDQALSALWKTDVLQAVHIPDGLAVGVRLDAIEALRSGRDDELTDDERQLVTYIRQVVDGEVTHESFDRIEARFGRRGAVEYTIVVAFLQMTIRLFQAFGIPGISANEVEEMLRDFREGRRELPDATTRFA
jgi:alkylhydroperoxidase family enzyme